MEMRRPVQEKKRFPVLLIILVPILLVGAVCLFIDRNARQAAKEAHEALKALPEPVTQESVRSTLGRDPDDPAAPYGKDRTREIYTWQGVPKKYVVVVTYFTDIVGAKSPEMAEYELTTSDQVPE